MPDEITVSLLTFETERTTDATVVHCHGKLVAGTTGDFYHEVRKLMPDSKRIVLDLTDLTYMDSLGLGTLARLYVSANAAGCELQLINLAKRIRELLGVTHLLSVFTVIGENGIRIL
jgi:anti-sigma B factor antagonist